MDLIEKIMQHFKCCESKAKSILKKYQNNGTLNILEELVKEG